MADITYVRLGEAFVYLAVVLDALSRKVIGWAIDDHLEARLAVEALEMALRARNPPVDSLIHHSDRGVQYASGDHTDRLQARDIGVFIETVYNTAPSFGARLRTARRVRSRTQPIPQSQTRR